MLLCCQLFFKVCGAHGEKNSQSHVLRQLVSSAFSMALFQNFTRYVKGLLFGRLSVETRFACCRPDSSQLLEGHTEQPVSAIVPNLVLIQVLGQLPELLLRSLRSRNVFFGRARRVGMVMHAMWMINNKGRLKHSDCRIIKMSSNHFGQDVRVVLVERKRTTYVTSANGRSWRGAHVCIDGEWSPSVRTTNGRS